MARRIRDLRRGKGLTQKQLADLFGVGQSTIAGWERGDFAPSRSHLVQLCTFFEVERGYIETGEDTRRRAIKVPINRIIGAGAKIMMVHEEPIDWVDAPPDSNAEDIQGFEVRGHSQHPVYRDRDLVFIAKSLDPDPARYIGLDCVVQLASGEMMLKVLTEQTAPGVFTLGSYNLADEPAVSVVRAAPVLFVKRANRPR